MNATQTVGADWELDFYSRPILEADGRKRWELLITATPAADARETPFRFSKRCPSGEVNSIWLSSALAEARQCAVDAGWPAPRRLRCWRSSMRTMVQRAATELDLEMIASRRTYALLDWLQQREQEVYPLEEGFMAGPLAPPPAPIATPPVPLPEEVQGDAWSWASLPADLLRDAADWPTSFSGLLPLQKHTDQPVPGLRLFSSSGLAMALAVGLEPSDCWRVVAGAEAGQDDRWLVSDLDSAAADAIGGPDHQGTGQRAPVHCHPNQSGRAGLRRLLDDA